jgi:hypothetical protein
MFLYWITVTHFQQTCVKSSGKRFYAWLKRPESPSRRNNLRLLTVIKAIHRRSQSLETSVSSIICRLLRVYSL